MGSSQPVRVRVFSWNKLAVGALVLLTTTSLRPAPFGATAPPARESKAGFSLGSSNAGPGTPQAGPVSHPNVEKGYFLFPIKPGKPNYLAGSMGELRPNHFHGGLDIKTDGRVDLPVYAAADGYISRMKQSSFGYGNVLYITHPNGLTTVYGHLNRFLGPVADQMRQQQYEKQTFELELFFTKEQFPVKRGDLVALSGNTGGSGGPHLHWEVRDAHDAQLNPLQWGGFDEIQDHVPPTIQAFAVEPLSIDARVSGRFDKAVLAPKLPVGPGVPVTWADTINCFGTIGLQVQAFDRFDTAWNRNGLQRVEVRVNGQPTYQYVIDGVPFSDTRTISDHIDYEWQHTMGRTLEKLFVDDGNILPIYTTGPSKGKLRVEDGKLYAVEVNLLDSYGNSTPLRFVLRGQQPMYYKTRSAAVRQPAVRYDITRNILKVSVADPDTASQGGNLTLLRNGRRLELKPSYTVQSQNVYLYDLRAGLPDSIRFGRVVQRFNRQALIPAGQEFAFSNSVLNLAFGPRTLFDTLYLQTSYKEGLWTIQNTRTPLFEPLRLTLKPEEEIIDKQRSAVYMINARGGRIYQGGKWDGNQITAPIKTFGSFRVLTDTIPPSARLVSKSAAGVTFVVGDNLSGLASYRLLVNGQWRLLRYEYKNATLFTDRQDHTVPLAGDAELHLTDQAGNEKVLRFRI
ncbi:M23 family metallopeptidase [Hymenobacter crusticola]|uniref:M23 family metallopeptidase n=1 Tax=Hymenobacter crusticola TaxID=1770526 RepID=UPI0015C50AF7|nr:M23 family metallopeptidase [Hymenobacter crusticola]